MSELTLYQTEDCPFCSLVRKKLFLAGLSYKIKNVDPDGAKRDEVKALTGQNSVPVFKHGEKTLSDSSSILEYIDITFGSGKPEAMEKSQFGFGVQVEGTADAVREEAIEVFKEFGFGKITEINMAATLKEKIGVEIPPSYILGFCNPKLAHSLSEIEPDVALLLPCNVVVKEIGENKVEISSVSPVKLLGLAGRPELFPLAFDARKKIGAALDKLESLLG